MYFVSFFKPLLKDNWSSRFFITAILFLWVIFIPGHAIFEPFYRSKWFFDYEDSFMKIQASWIDISLLIIGIGVLLYALIRRWNWDRLIILAICILGYTVYTDAKKPLFNEHWGYCVSSLQDTTTHYPIMSLQEDSYVFYS